MGSIKIIARNRKARYDYFVKDSFEVGMVLTGSEIKSIRARQVNLRYGYAVVRDNELWLLNVHIAPYKHASYQNHEPRRERKLLMHRREINRLIGKIREKGHSLVPLKLYLKRGLAKVELGLVRGKKQYDKRQKLRERDNDRRVNRALGQRQKGW